MSNRPTPNSIRRQKLPFVVTRFQRIDNLRRKNRGKARKERREARVHTGERNPSNGCDLERSRWGYEYIDKEGLEKITSKIEDNGRER